MCEELEPILLEVEMVTNSRPVTYINNEPMDALSSSHLVIMNQWMPSHHPI